MQHLPAEQHHHSFRIVRRRILRARQVTGGDQPVHPDRKLRLEHTRFCEGLASVADKMESRTGQTVC